MRTLDHTPTIAAAPRQAVVARVVNLFSAVYRSWKNRRDFERLGQLSDTELADIGLRRVDLHAVDDLPFFVDPTQRLSVIAEQRVRSDEQRVRSDEQRVRRGEQRVRSDQQRVRSDERAAREVC
jgi:uncharacterized protein YjiS (DUF1127 family)